MHTQDPANSGGITLGSGGAFPEVRLATGKKKKKINKFGANFGVTMSWPAHRLQLGAEVSTL
jgi:hypothetical protein